MFPENNLLRQQFKTVADRKNEVPYKPTTQADRRGKNIQKQQKRQRGHHKVLSPAQKDVKCKEGHHMLLHASM